MIINFFHLLGFMKFLKKFYHTLQSLSKADFDADVYNDLIEYQFSNIVKLMSGLGMDESIQEKVLKELSANLAALMVMEN